MIGRDNPLPAAPSGIAFVDSVTGPVTNNTSQWTHTIASGTNCLLVGVFCNDLANGPTALSIDSGGPFTVLRTIE
jgi:hypothetical protein